MTRKEKEMELAYVLGATMGEKTGDHKSINLNTICDEWTGYRIAGFGSTERNGSWMLIYDGPFGASKICSRIISIEEGLSVAHTCHLITEAIMVHMSETK